MCQVVEAELTHHFQGVAMRQPALRFKLLGAAASTVDDSPLWMGTEEYMSSCLGSFQNDLGSFWNDLNHVNLRRNKTNQNL